MAAQVIEIPEEFKETEIGPLPMDWEVVKLGDVCTVDWGNTTITKASYTSDGYLAFSATGQDGRIPFFEHEGNAVILSAIGARCGKCFWARGKWTAIKNTIIIKANAKIIDLFFIYFYINEESYWHKSGTGQPFIGIGNAKNQFIPLPPFTEQHKIAHILSTIQRAVELQDKVIAAVRHLKKSLMSHLFTYGPVPIDQVDRVPLKETKIGPVPEHWEVVRLGEVVVKTQYGLSKRGEVYGKYPILRMNNLGYGRINPTDLQYVDLEEKTYTQFRLCKGDLLFNRTNSYELVGKTAIFDLDTDYVFASYIIRLTPDIDKINSKFLNYYINTELAQHRLKLLASRGVSQSNINATKLKTFVVPIPPLADQRQIVNILTTVDQKIEVEEKRKSSLQSLFYTILDLLMTGQVRVNDLEVTVGETGF